MADPLSITGLVLQVGAVVKQLYDYGKHVKSARKDINTLCGDLLALKGILEDLRDHRAEPDDEDSINTILKRARVLLSDLLQQLEPGLAWHHRAKQALKWPFDKARIDEILTDLERIKTALLLALMGDYQSALSDISQMKDEVSAIKGNVQDVRDIVTNEADSRKRQRQIDSLEKLYKRIAPVSPATKHRKICTVWQGTKPGSWFVDGPLKTWLDDPEPEAPLMALCGVSGAGKSTIISRVIEELGTRDRGVSVAYFYCAYNEVATHEVRNVLGSWLVQLSHHAKTRELSEFTRYLSQDAEIPVELLQEALASAAEAIGPVILVLDALNESTQPEKLLTSMLGVFQKCKGIRCLISTTLHIGGALQRLDCPYVRVTMSSDSIKRDVADYIRRTVRGHDILKAVGEERFLDALVPRTQGMFRWASCQMNILSEYLTVKMVRRALEDLPGSLDEVYVFLLQRVQPMFRGPVREALLWLTYSLRPLYLTELTEAIVIEIGESSIDDSSRIHPPHRILELCQGLVVWDESTGEVFLAHSSVATFLKSEFIRSSTAMYFALHRGEAVSSMIQKLLSYILMDTFQSGPCQQHSLLQCYTRYPLLDYSTTMWAMHTFDIARMHGRLREVEARMVLKLFSTHRDMNSGGNFAFWVQCLVPFARANVIKAAVPLYYAASFGLTPIVVMMFEHNQIDVQDHFAPWYIDKSCGGGGATPLIVACYRGHIDVVRVLLKHGARPNLVDGLGVSGRTWARVRGYRAIARVMRDSGGVEKDDINYIHDYIDEDYSVDEADNISGHDDFPASWEMPYNGMFRHIKQSKGPTKLYDRVT